jgi:hypothetical protein
MNSFEAQVPSHSLLPAPMQRVLELAQGNAVLQALYVATKLGIADLLAEGPKTCAELAGASASNPDGLYRVLRLLARFEVFAEPEPGRFALSPAAEALRDRPGSLRDFVLYSGEEFYQAWGNFLQTLHTPESAFEITYGMNRCDYLSRHPGKQGRFEAGTQAGADIYVPALAAAYDFSRLSSLVDIGRGDRNYLPAILQRCPELRGIWVEKPDLAEAARQRLARLGLAERCQVEAGNPLAPPPAGSDGYLVSNAHRLEDGEAVHILRNCRKAMAAGGRVFLIERFITGRTPWTLLGEDLGLSVQTTGRLRTLDEFQALLAAGGFRLRQLAPVDATRGVFEAEPLAA